MSQLLSQFQDFLNKVNSLSDAREFYVPVTASSSGASHVLSQPMIIPTPKEMRSRDSGLPRDTRNVLWILRATFLKAYLLENDHPQVPSKIKGIWQHLLIPF